MKNLLLFTVLALLFSCKKIDSTTIPVSDFSSIWVPANEDSVLFTTKWKAGISQFKPDTNYLIYNNYQSAFGGQNPQLQTISQQAFCTDGNFTLTFNLQAGLPEISDTSRSKTDVLTLTFAGTQSNLFISKKAVTGNFYFIDTMYVAGRTYLNVLTDSTGYFFNQSDGIVAFSNGSKWFYKVD